MFRGEPVNVSEGRPGASCRPADAALTVAGGGWRRRRQGGPRGARSHVCVRRGGAVGRVVGGDRQAYSSRREHRYRRKRSRPGDGVCSARVVCDARAHRAFRLERGPGRSCDGDEAISILPRRSSSSSRRRCRRSRPSRTHDAAREWLVAALGSGADLARHVVGVAVRLEAGERIGVPPENVFRMWDWVGGRTSLCSAVGLSLLIALGDEDFRALLGGFHAMDEHFATAALGGNLPVICGLLSLWYRDFMGAETIAVVPYSHALRLLPAYLQQLWMESNGKSVTTTGEPVAVDSGIGPVGRCRERTRSTRSSSSSIRGPCWCPST